VAEFTGKGDLQKEIEELASMMGRDPDDLVNELVDNYERIRKNASMVREAGGVDAFIDSASSTPTKPTL
jgi:hypothetical protein